MKKSTERKIRKALDIWNICFCIAFIIWSIFVLTDRIVNYPMSGVILVLIGLTIMLKGYLIKEKKPTKKELRIIKQLKKFKSLREKRKTGLIDVLEIEKRK